MTRDDTERELLKAWQKADEQRPIKIKLNAIIEALQEEAENNSSTLINSVYYLVCVRREKKFKINDRVKIIIFHHNRPITIRGRISDIHDEVYEITSDYGGEKYECLGEKIKPEE